MAVVVVLATGCVGSIDRDEFSAIVRERGGGLSGDLLVEAVERVEAEVGVPVLVRSATVTHLNVSLTVSTADRPEETDSWSWSGGTLRGPNPSSDLDDDARRRWFGLGVLDADRIEAAIDAALAASELRGPYASTLLLQGVGDDEFEATVSLTNQRSSETWRFGTDGAPERVS